MNATERRSICFYWKRVSLSPPSAPCSSRGVKVDFHIKLNVPVKNSSRELTMLSFTRTRRNYSFILSLSFFQFLHRNFSMKYFYFTSIDISINNRRLNARTVASVFRILPFSEEKSQNFDLILKFEASAY